MGHLLKYVVSIGLFLATLLMSYLLLPQEEKKIFYVLLPLLCGVFVFLAYDRIEVWSFLDEVKKRQREIDLTLALREMSADEANARIVANASRIRHVKNSVLYMEKSILTTDAATEKTKKLSKIIIENSILWEEILFLRERADLVGGAIAGSGEPRKGNYRAFLIPGGVQSLKILFTEFCVIEYEDGHQEVLFGFSDKVGDPNVSRCFLTSSRRIVDMFYAHFEHIASISERLEPPQASS